MADHQDNFNPLVKEDPLLPDWGELSGLDPEGLDKRLNQKHGNLDFLGNGDEALLAGLFGPFTKNPSREEVIKGYYLGDPLATPASTLTKWGLFKREHDFPEDIYIRRPEKVTSILIHESADRKGPIKNTHLLVTDAWPPVSLFHDPDSRSRHRGHIKDNELVIYLDNGSHEHKVPLSEKQKAALRDVLLWAGKHYPHAERHGHVPTDVKDALTQEIIIEEDDDCHCGGGISGHNLHWEKAKGLSPYRISDDKNLLYEELNTCGRLDSVKTMTADERKDFAKKLKAVLTSNEGPDGYQSYTPDDHGNGISVGKAQWNQRKGELPNLFQEWLDTYPEKFHEIFRTYENMMMVIGPPSPEHPNGEINEGKDAWIRTADLAHDAVCVRQLKLALADSDLDKCQETLLDKKVERAIALAEKYGHSSTRFIAQVLDVANQKGWGGCEARMRNGNVACIPPDAEGECLSVIDLENNSADRAGAQRRNAELDKVFAPGRKR